MTTITFTARIENGTIEIPEQYKHDLTNCDRVEVTIIKKKKISDTKIISQLIKNPIKVTGFIALTRDEAHERE